jgi:hypothetical protein
MAPDIGVRLLDVAVISFGTATMPLDIPRVSRGTQRVSH